jgi:hypothetical protein
MLEGVFGFVGNRRQIVEARGISQRIEIDDAVAATNGKPDNRGPDKTSPACD